MTTRRNFVSPYTKWQQLRTRLHRIWGIIYHVALPGAALLVGLWWWIAG